MGVTDLRVPSGVAHAALTRRNEILLNTGWQCQRDENSQYEWCFFHCCFINRLYLIVSLANIQLFLIILCKKLKIFVYICRFEPYPSLSMVNQHKDLLKPGDQCIGGGYYHFDFVSNRIIRFHDDFNVSDELKIEYYDWHRPCCHGISSWLVNDNVKVYQIII